MKDVILIRGLELWSSVGVPPSERAHPQRLELDAEIFPQHAFHHLEDDIAHTVDYDLACCRLREIAAERPRQLIETLAVDLAQALLQEFPARAVTIEIRKFVLPGVAYVGVRHHAEQ